MHIRQFCLVLLCLGALTAVGLQSLRASGATEVTTMRVAQTTGDEGIIYLPLTSKEDTAITPTVTVTPTVDPSPTPPSTVIVADLFVDDSNTTGNEDGTAQHPYANLQAAINVASGDAITIAVAAGLYSENIL